MKRLDVSEWKNTKSSRQMRDWLQRYELPVASRLGDAQDFIDLEIAKLREPPAGWLFVEAYSSYIEQPDRGPIGLTDGQSIDAHAFWAWYMPLESHLLRLCELIAFFGQKEHRIEHSDTLRALCGVGVELQSLYGEHQREKRIKWLPVRSRYGPKRKPCSILDLLSAHLIAFNRSFEPEWAREVIPDSPERAMEMPF